jgi:two-component system, chemotaxis family, protein-glutamate methylesterase/glutaminase
VPRRDIIVIGASAGGVTALRALASGLPADLRAAVFVVVHSSPQSPGILPRLLTRVGRLPAVRAVDGATFRQGCIYVAPPDRHLLIDDGRISVTLGPRENGFRPAVDPLFRSAAAQHGPRVVGIILSGGLDDGTRGLQLIKREGGVAIAQDVEEATIPNMPLSAIRNVEVDHVLPAAEIPALIARLASSGRAVRMKKRRPTRTKLEPARGALRGLEEGRPSGPPSAFTCPECGGALWERRSGKIDSFHCHVGHGFSAESLGAGMDGRVETALWTAFRTLEEGAVFQRRLAERARRGGLAALARAHENRAQGASERAALLQQVLSNDWLAVPGRKAAPRPERRRGSGVKRR